MKRSKPISVLLSLGALTACSQNPVVVTESVPVLPPAAMIQPVPEPAYTGTTNEDHLNYTLDLRAALRECNAQFEALRQWREGNSQ